MGERERERDMNFSRSIFKREPTSFSPRGIFLEVIFEQIFPFLFIYLFFFISVLRQIANEYLYPWRYTNFVFNGEKGISVGNKNELEKKLRSLRNEVLFFHFAF